MLKFVVPTSLVSASLKEFLRTHYGVSLTLWRKIKCDGKIRINGCLSDFTATVHAGDQIDISYPDPCDIIPTPLPLNVHYEDEYLLIVDKPADMLVHPIKNEDRFTLANAIISYYRRKNLPYGFHPIHRLDRNTSGLVAIAKNPFIQHSLARDQVKSINRYYLAITHGTIVPSKGVIDVPIGRDPDSIIRRMVRADGQQAVTYYRVIENLRKASLVETKLLTGRTHQIRVHLSHIGHPIWGDDLYGKVTDPSLITRQALHAYKLHFTHPITKKPIKLMSSLPDDIKTLLAYLCD